MLFDTMVGPPLVYSSYISPHASLVQWQEKVTHFCSVIVQATSHFLISILIFCRCHSSISVNSQVCSCIFMNNNLFYIQMPLLIVARVTPIHPFRLQLLTNGQHIPFMSTAAPLLVYLNCHWYSFCCRSQNWRS